MFIKYKVLVFILSYMNNVSVVILHSLYLILFKKHIDNWYKKYELQGALICRGIKLYPITKQIDCGAF
jgi:hypothetical protein